MNEDNKIKNISEIHSGSDYVPLKTTEESLLNPEPQIILVVDDDKTMRQSLRQELEQQGYKVVEAGDGSECLAAYTRCAPNIVLLDAGMPVMDGFTCCTQLKKLPRGDRTPVLMMMAMEDRESVDRAFEVGARDYITKPIHWTVLRQRLRHLIEQFQLHQQLESANRQLQLLANYDNLTKLATRRQFDDYFDLEWRRLAQTQSPLCVIFCDLDFFKGYNDAYGHLAGDFCLQQVAGALRTATKRSAELVARYAGEKFAVILSNTSSDYALQVAEHMRNTVKALEIPHERSPVSPYITISLGVATTVPTADADPALLIAAADEALYLAKNQGRDAIWYAR